MKQNQEQKKSYQSPRLKRYGDVVQLTQSVCETGFDSTGMRTTQWQHLCSGGGGGGS